MNPDIPKEIVGAAVLIQNWMIQNGEERWCLMNVCSRNHAEELSQWHQAAAAFDWKPGDSSPEQFMESIR